MTNASIGKAVQRVLQLYVDRPQFPLIKEEGVLHRKGLTLGATSVRFDAILYFSTSKHSQ